MTGEKAVSRIRQFPADLAVVLLFVLVTNFAILAPAISDSPIRAVLAIPFVLFLPGYALIAALFPQAGESPVSNVTARSDESSSVLGIKKSSGPSRSSRDREIDGVERAGLSFALSVALIPLVALLVAISPAQFGFVSMLLTINLLTVVSTFVAAARRLSLPAEKRYRVPFQSWKLSIQDAVTGVDSRSTAVLNGALVIAIIFAVSAFGFAMIQPPDGEQYTELQILSEESNENLVASEYPDTLSPDEQVPLHIQIENHEQESVEYTAVVQLQRVEEGDSGLIVTERTELDRFSTTLNHNESWIDERQLTTTGELTGEDLQLKVLLYQGDVPADPNSENAYEDAHLWVDVPPQQN